MLILVLQSHEGIYGRGVGEMAKQIGAVVNILEFPWDSSLNEWAKIREAALEFRPHLLTVIHCDTPTGTCCPYIPR